MTKIYPKCKFSNLSTKTHLAITWEGYIAPCCPFAAQSFSQIEDLLGDKVEQLHISSGTLDEINRSEAMHIIEQTFYNNPMEQCIRMCGEKPPELEKDSQWMECNTPFMVVHHKTGEQ